VLYKQHSPFSVQVELVEGCSLACSFCGINGIRKGPGNFKYARLGMLSRVAAEIARLKWTPRIEFAMHGEPSLHPKLLHCVRVFRRRLPHLSLMLTSNGAGFRGKQVERIVALQRAGLNVLGLDNYDHDGSVPGIVRMLHKKHPSVPVRYYPEDKAASVYRKRKPDSFEVVVLADIRKHATGTRKLANHAGQAFPPDTSKQNQRCALPFRDLAIRWDGNVAICCDDFRGTYKIANVKDMPLDALWQHPRFVAARKALYHRLRDFLPCAICNATSIRPGLLPDPTGQESLPFPSSRDNQAMKDAVANGPYTKPVKRPWEM